jgi:hypothetical protein
MALRDPVCAWRSSSQLIASLRAVLDVAIRGNGAFRSRTCWRQSEDIEPVTPNDGMPPPQIGFVVEETRGHVRLRSPRYRTQA